MNGLTSAPPPPPGPGDHVRGDDGPEALLYLDLACPYCAAAWARIRELPIRLWLRHFPVAGKHPRAPALHRAAEAAARQREDAFAAIWDSLLVDRTHTDDPHLWERVKELGLDLERFERDRRSEAVSDRVRHDFTSGIRAGVATTPAAFLGGDRVQGEAVEGRLAAAADTA